MNERDKHLTKVAISLLASNPIVADATIRVASMINETTNQIIPQLSRRDFLKFVATVSAVKAIPNLVENSLRSPDAEQFSEFAGNVIAEAGTGPVSKLQPASFNILEQIVLRRIAQQDIKPNFGKIIATKLFNMVGQNNDASFAIAYEIDHRTEEMTGRSWVGFGVEEVKIDNSDRVIAALKPPTVFSQMKFIEMDTVSAGEGKLALGPISSLDGGIAPLFTFDILTDDNGTTTFENPMFIPPYADQVNSGPVEAPHSLTRHARIKRPEQDDIKLPDEVLKKFEKAGIKVEDLDIQQDGLHIMLNDKTTVTIPHSKLDKFVNVGFESKDFSFGEDHFLPVFDSDTGNTTIFIFDKVERKWILDEILPLPNPKDKNSLNFRLLASGSLNEMVKRMNISFPPDAICNGWTYPGNDHGYIIPKGKSVEWPEPIVFNMDANKFLGLNRQFELMCLPILNEDDSVTCVNLCITNVGTAPTVNEIKSVLKTNGIGVGLKVPSNLADVIKYMSPENTFAIGARIQYLFDVNETKMIMSNGDVKKLSNKINLPVL